MTPADEALAWVRTLRSRGVRITLRNGRLHLHPSESYYALTNAERRTFKFFRAEIKALVRDGAGDAEPQTPKPTQIESEGKSANFADLNESVAPKRETPPPPCAWCLQSPCVGPSHPHFRTLHYNDPAEIQRRADENTRVMYFTSHPSYRRQT